MSTDLRTERAAIAVWAATGHKALDWVYMAPEDERVRWCMHLGAAVIAAEDKAKVTPEVAELDPIVAAFINARTEYVEALRQTRGTDNQGDYNRWQGHAAARRQLAQSLGYTVPSEMGSTTRRETE
ncbi:hypothetical protein [Paeniglutamicibacter terrestris]|uniref:Uncharacterized protein n=1 Tax=Paeniglutamicibacter terrestris TaxID=2723403 RepID=A0ABX1G495_9MICC|nr:hypothetical protein [Paeniglutamicibacter terrestris]NKG21058.1 hypothetical protein [Paeniglutamicibacter terrestris]